MRDGRECVPPMYRLLYNPWGVHITVTEIHVRHTSLYCYIIIFLSSFTFSFGHTVANSTKGFDAKWIGVMVPLSFLLQQHVRPLIGNATAHYAAKKELQKATKTTVWHTWFTLIVALVSANLNLNRFRRENIIIAENWILPHENVLGTRMSTESIVHRGQW